MAKGTRQQESGASVLKKDKNMIYDGKYIMALSLLMCAAILYCVPADYT